MNPASTLETVTEDFTTWRTTRNHHRIRTPLDLQKKALALKNHYPISKIVIALGINSDALKRWSFDASRGKKILSTDPAFISLPSVDQIPVHSECNAVAHCEFPNVLTLTFLANTLSPQLL